MERKPSMFETAASDFAQGLRAEADRVRDPQIARYLADPVAWMVDTLGVPERTLRWSINPGYEHHAWDGDVDPLVQASLAVAAGKNVGIESGTGTGKTFWLAAIAAWFADMYEGAIVVSAAPKEDQLKKNMWKELTTFYPRIKARHPRADKQMLSLKYAPPGEAWSISGFATGVGADEEVAQKAAGLHAPHMLIIAEETPGIKPAIMAAFEQTCVAPHNLRIAVGNPDHRHDPLHQFCVDPNVVAIRISALDHPNVVCDDPFLIPGAVSRKSVDARLKKYGETGRLYLSRVRGMSPDQPADALVRLEWCHAARDRGIELARAITGDADATLADLGIGAPGVLEGTLAERFPDLAGVRALGIDVANSKSGDEASIARGVGAVLLGVDSFPCQNSNVLGAEVAVEIRQMGIDPDAVGVDGVGVGAGCVNQLLAEGLPARNLMGGPVDTGEGEEKFAHLRSQMWWAMREALRFGLIVLPNDEDLFEDLTTPTWTTRNGVIQVQKKEELRKALGRSPNKGDAAVYWNWVRAVRAAGSIGGDPDVSLG